MNGKTVAVIALMIALIAILSESGKAEDARVLPKGRSRLSFVYGKSASISQGFNSNGERETILGRYGAESIQLTSENLRKFEPKVNALINLLNEVGHYDLTSRTSAYHGYTRDPEAPLLGDSLTLGSVFAEAKAERTVHALSYQYGVTDRLSAGFMIPFIQNKVSVNYGFSGNRNVEDILRIATSSDPYFKDHQDALSLLKSLNDATFQDILTSRGYSRFGNYEGGGLGDAAMGARYNYLFRKYRSGQWTNSVQSFLTLPTGKTKPTRALTELGTGNGTVDLMTAHVTNYQPFKFLILSNGAYYTYRFANRAPVRVRKDPDDILPDASSEETLHQKLADKMWTNLGAKFLATDALSIEMSYEWFWKGRDRYQGSRADRDTTYLSETSDSAPSSTGTLQLGASVSSIPGFLRSELPVPLDFSMNLYLPMQGKNAIVTPYGTAELALYF